MLQVYAFSYPSGTFLFHRGLNQDRLRVGEVERGGEPRGALGIHYRPLPTLSAHVETVWTPFIYAGVSAFDSSKFWLQHCSEVLCTKLSFSRHKASCSIAWNGLKTTDSVSSPQSQIWKVTSLLCLFCFLEYRGDTL